MDIPRATRTRGADEDREEELAGWYGPEAERHGVERAWSGTARRQLGDARGRPSTRRSDRPRRRRAEIPRRRVAATPRARRGYSVAFREDDDVGVARDRGVSGKLAEMATGEGKTLVATCPLYLRSLDMRGTHVITVNDYLARRDSETLQPLFDFLGLTVGVVQSESTSAQRRAAYECDVTYVTNNELGFDYLRDHLAHVRPRGIVLRRTAAPPRVPRGSSAEDESRRRRGRDVDISSRRVAAAPRVPRGNFVETSRGAVAAATRMFGQAESRRGRGRGATFREDERGAAAVDIRERPVAGTRPRS